ncbi:MAG TPA: PAS domain S-box protein, partial [Steroidobacteraceae bacterium]|nr:PAS domain S-box protein [Steroidobacteraceae bacterium]
MSAASEKLSSSARIDESLDATAAALTSLAGTEVGFAAVAQQLPLTIIVLDRELRVRWINGVAAESVNLRADEAIGAHWPSIARGPADRFANYERVLAGELVEVSDVTVPRDDTTSHYRGLCRPMRSPTGDIVGILIVGEDVTAQRTAEKALAESERRFRMLAEQSRDIVAVVSTQGELLYVNHATMQILGYAPEEVMGRSGFEMVHPDDAARVRGRLRAVLTEGPDRTPQSVEYRVRHKDGSWRWLETLPAILSEDPEGHSVLTASRDVTERRRAEDALRLSEERYRLAIRAMNGVIYEWNVATGRVLRTPGLGDWLELPENAVPADIDSWLARVHPDERLAQDEICALLLRDGQFESSYRIQTASGDYARLWERSILVRDAQGRPERVIGFIVDRTEASRTQALLEATEETAAIGGWEQNFLTGQIYWTDRVFRLHGIEPDASGCYYEDTRRFFAPSSIPLIEAAIDAARSRGIPFDVETKMVSATGRIWWARIVAQVERDGDGRSVRAYGAIQDITERKQAEIEIVAKSGWLEVALSTAQMSAWRLDLVSGTIYQAARSSLLRRMIVEPHTLESLFDAIHPADRHGVVEAMERVKQVDDTYDVEYRTRMADGSWAYKHSFGRLERDAAGQAIALIGATQDITDRRRVETALRASESTLRQVTQHSSDSITLLDRELRIRFTNRSVSGLSPEALEGRYLAEFLPEDRSATVLGCLRRVLATGRPDSYALEYAAELGGMRHYEFRVSPIADGAAISGLVVNGSDVTRHILAERAIATQAR